MLESTGTTIRDYAQQVQPLEWGDRSQFDLARFFDWPPDVFALTSLLLQATGAYRRAISPPKGDPWPPADWVRSARDMAESWCMCTGARLNLDVGEACDLPKGISKRLKVLSDNADLEIDELYESTRGKGSEAKNAWVVCKALLELHSVADEAMNGVGVVNPTRGFLRGQPYDDGGQEETASRRLVRVHLHADFLLTVRGSLSRLPKFRGIVLPKSRTPQVGLSLRSLSNHLTFHHSEVDVAWRSFPWFNIDENSVHMMLVPWPYEVHADSFSPVPHPGTREALGADRYFHCRPKGSEAFDPWRVVDAIRRSHRELRRIHVLIFPELALEIKELEGLQKALTEAFPPHQIPMIITGISGPLEKKGTLAGAEEGTGYNRVILSFYYVGRWYDVVQEKHHQWRLDGGQVEQYNLGGFLPGNRAWWESIAIPRRRLTVMSANSWLTLCPLICEDLARLEPVSDLIRGIGPTLLVGLLMDGPQLVERWPARYASVLADDPGTSVLTITSLGMSRRTAPQRVDTDKEKLWKKKSNTFALWKDERSSWQEVLSEEGQEEPKTLVVSATWVSEKTADGRLNDDSSASFVFSGLVQPPAPTVDDEKRSKEEQQQREDKQKNLEAAEQREKTATGEAPSGESQKEPATDRDETKHLASDGKYLDICELAMYTYLVDALVEPSVEQGEIEEWFEQAVRRDAEPMTGETLGAEILRLIRKSIDTRQSVPNALPSPHLLLGVQQVQGFVRAARDAYTPDTADLKEPDPALAKDLSFWKFLADRARDELAFLKSGFEAPEEQRPPSQWPSWFSIPSGGETSLDGLLADAAAGALERARTFGNADRVEAMRGIRLPDAGRIFLATPLTILWAIHVRLSARRRFGLLSAKGGELFKDIEEIMVDDEDSSILSAELKGYNRAFNTWRIARSPSESSSAPPTRSSDAD